LRALLLALVFLSPALAQAQNLLLNGNLANPSVPNPGAAAIGTTTTAISNWSLVQGTSSSSGNNYSVNGRQTSFNWIPNPPASAPSTFSVQLDSNTNGTSNAANNTIAYNNTLSLLANTKYDLSFYFASEAPNGPNNGSQANARVALNNTTGVTITSVTMVNAGAATGNNVATGFRNSFSGTTATLVGPTSVVGDTSNTQPWVLVNIFFSTTSAQPSLPAGSLLFTDLGSTIGDNSSFADFSLVRVVPEFSNWTVPMAFVVAFTVVESIRWRRRFRSSR
jgi:hypothetical protein